MMAAMGPKPAAEAFSQASNRTAGSGRGDLEAVARSAQAYLMGMQDLGRQYAAAMRGLTRHALEGGRAFAGAKGLPDAIALQAGLARASIERALGEGAKLRQATLTLTGQVYAPLARRATAAVERTKVSRAA